MSIFINFRPIEELMPIADGESYGVYKGLYVVYRDKKIVRVLQRDLTVDVLTETEL